MDTQNDGLEKVTPFKHGNFWYISMLDFWGVSFAGEISVAARNVRQFERPKKKHRTWIRPDSTKRGYLDSFLN